VDFSESKAAEELRNSGYGEDFIYAWFTTPNAYLDDLTPLECLGDDPDGVDAAARMRAAAGK
jgi:hypothetical protein